MPQQGLRLQIANWPGRCSGAIVSCKKGEAYELLTSTISCFPRSPARGLLRIAGRDGAAVEPHQNA